MSFTELAFVTARMIKLLNFIMRRRAILIEASFLVDLFTFSMVINLEIRSSIVILIMIEET